MSSPEHCFIIPEMSLLASIDVGSNTLRLLIGRIEDNRIIDVFSDRKITRLGNRVDQTGRLQDENIEVSIAALKEFSSVISRYGVLHVKAVATSALREASNADIFIEKVFDATGIPIEVIPGEKEAELTLKGVLMSFPLPPLVRGRTGGLHPHSMFIVDIGGGSTEWILYRDQDHIEMGSMPIGVIRLSQNFLKTDPVSETDMIRLNREIIPVIEDLKKKIGHFIYESTLFIGTAGTFTTIASIDLRLDNYSREKIHLHRLSLERLLSMSKKLQGLSLKEREKLRGLEPERADLIIPGIQFTIKVMELFKLSELVISDYGLLEGVLLESEEANEKNISETRES
jgi:exopolyphosphatase/guanosine-5'-triphosphate,3'-diphosphate pyrophosphatase